MKQSHSKIGTKSKDTMSEVFTIYPGKSLHDMNALIANKEKITDLLHMKGAILCRDFHIDSPEKFKAIANMFTNDLMSDNGEHNPLPNANGVYTPVAYSAKNKLLWHNENSFNYTWPLIIMFCAAIPAETGGETPVVDSRKVLHALDESILEEFKSKGVMYTRTHGFGFGRSWQETYRIYDKSQLEQSFEKQNIQYEWYGNDQLMTKQVRPAIVEHPISRELSWFNQAQHWHPYCLQPEVRQSLLRIFSEDQLPRNCFFGDGSKISDDIMQHILNAYKKFEIAFPWEQGDVMVLDNVLYAHARNPYQGERKLLVTMGKHATFLNDVAANSRLL